MTFRLSQIRFASIVFTTAAVFLVLLHTSTAAGPEPPTAVIIRLTSDGRILFKGESVSLSRLAATVRAAADIRRSELILRADRQVPHSMILSVLDALGLSHSSPILLDAPGPAYREQLRQSTL